MNQAKLTQSSLNLLKLWQYTNCPYNPTLLCLFQTLWHSFVHYDISILSILSSTGNQTHTAEHSFLLTIQSTTPLLNPFTVPNRLQTLSRQRQCYNPIHNTPTNIYVVLSRTVTRYQYYKPNRIYLIAIHRPTEQKDTSLLYLLPNRDYIPDKVLNGHN